MDHSNNTQALTLDFILGRDLALLLLSVTAISAVLLLIFFRSKRLIILAFALTIIQGVHSYEHLLQAVKWLDQPYQPGYMSYPAQLIATGYGSLADKLGYTGTGLGMELLHLVGNILFLIGAISIYITRKNQISLALLYFESIHVIEHITLTLTTATGRPAWGASTLFAKLSGAELTSFRVSWHLVMNLLGFVLAVLALSKPKINLKKTTLTISTLILTSLPLAAALTTPPDPGYLQLSQLIFTPVGLTSLILTPSTIALLTLLLLKEKTKTEITEEIATKK
ncbi:MAG: DUF6008 family protein [Candidatus Paceibacterota bacterium]